MDSSLAYSTPASESGVEIEILKQLITPEEAEIACHLSGDPEDVSTIAERAGMESEKIRPLLDAMAKKGVIFKVFGETPLYALVPMVPGVYELQVGTLTPQMAVLWETYFEEKLGQSFLTNETPLVRVVPVNQAVTTDLNILTYEEVEKILDQASAITLTDCLCRTKKKMLGQGCDGPIKDICIYLEDWAEFLANTGRGRRATREEAKKALMRAEEAGLVHNTTNVQEAPFFICSCCSCCCGVLRGVAEFRIPTAVARSNFYPEISEADCSGCGECVDLCHVHALEMDGDTAALDLDQCIGCGVCVSKCPVDAITLKRKEFEHKPSKTRDEMLARVAEGRA
jgi:ferredoxin